MFEFPNPLIDQNDSYTLFDASVTWTAENEKLRLQLVGRNLTDEEYLQEVIPAPEFGGSFVHPSARDSYGIDLEYRF